MGALLPSYTTPEELAEHLGVSERTLRERARILGACRTLGKRMILLEGDVQLLLEDLRPCRSNSTGAQAAKSGTTGAPLPVGDYEALREQRTRNSPSGSPQKSKRGHGGVISMAPRPR
jgi:hypothetical protein